MVLDMTTRLVRHPGHPRCAGCRRRRVVFSLVSESTGGSGKAESPRVCAECAGIVIGSQPIGVDEAIAALPKDPPA